MNILVTVVDSSYFQHNLIRSTQKRRELKIKILLYRLIVVLLLLRVHRLGRVLASRIIFKDPTNRS